ncbi:ribosomal L11 methyltransferase [Chlorella sorokiniana]|uniref:type I protein arginine methyltransferase n=1 Tax=Chlorella sorokiniana TaxID=3076 RepID=A0A2P6TLV1_CHLSO|nr:ribosomal L11 methyltransferase [Chlorella sorokiniana]|eukprot:PRW45255.1 ribosomal L11 methyltransferase [Chlorella sorokiniana]
MGQAAAALGQAAAAADAFRRCTELTAHAQPGTQLHALHQTATDNLLLESAAVLPPSWIASLHDEPWLAALQAGIAAALQQASQCSSDGTQLPPRVLVCGGLGLEAVLAAQAGAQHVAMLCQDNPLTARLAAELAAASGCADRVTTATSADQLGAGAQPGGYNLVILADALGSSVDWGLLQRQLAAVAPLLVQHGGSSGSGQHCAAAASIVLPHAVRICGQLVQCAAAVALNQVDVEQMAADTGGLDLSTANELLPRARRSLQLPSYQHTALSSPTTLLTVPLASLLSCSVEDGSTASHQPASGRMAVTTAGSADALCWWLEQQVVADGADEPQQQPPLLSSSPSSCPAGEAALHLHIWQHLEYMNRQQLAAGEAVDVRCQLGGSSGGGGGGSSGAAYVAASGMQDLSLGDIPASGKAAASLNFSVQLQDGSSGSGSTAGQSLLLPVTSEQAAVAAAVPQYHTSMLNDSARTVAYRDGIAAAMLEAEAKAAAAAAADSQPQPRRPLVLEIGSGSGLLLLLARKAGASHSVGCERLPELQQVAAQLLQANGAAHSVAVLPKHSRELAVAEGSSGSGSGNDEVSSAADLPRRADVLLHEIFGTDPFSEVEQLLHVC